MQKSTLGLYMQKVAEGDLSFAGRLCAQLADRLIYIPTKAQAKSGQAVKVSIVRLFEDGSYVVPVFTAEKKLRDWATHSGRTVDAISLLGADFCSALDGETSISIDPESESSVKLGPNFVREISMSGGSGDYGEMAASVAERVSVPAAPQPVSPPVVPSSLASFPGGIASPSSSQPLTPPSPPPRSVRKEEFPPFVPPSAQAPEPSPPAQRVIERPEPPIGETIRAHRSSLAAGVLMGPGEDDSGGEGGSPNADTAGASSAPTQHEPATEKKKKGLFGLFTKK